MLKKQFIFVWKVRPDDLAQPFQFGIVQFKKVLLC